MPRRDGPHLDVPDDRGRPDRRRPASCTTAAPDLLTFVVATAALAGLAWVVSFATEQVGERFGPAMTGVLQSTLGNLPEFFVVLFALERARSSSRRSR